MIASKYFTNSAKSGLDATMVRLFYVTWIRSRFRSSIDHCDEDIIAALASNKWALHIKWLVAEAVDDEMRSSSTVFLLRIPANVFGDNCSI